MQYTNVTFNGDERSRVPGMVFEVTDAELALADEYEEPALYTRIRVTLASGREAWVYRCHSTRITRHINATRSAVYRALIDPVAVGQWMVPAGMTSEVHAFEAREGGAFRISLTYDEATGTGKSSAHTDTYHGRFVELVPDERLVEVVEFETADPGMKGEMTITITLADADGGTDVVAVHHALPIGIKPSDNDLGWRMSLDKLAALVEK